MLSVLRFTAIKLRLKRTNEINESISEIAIINNLANYSINIRNFFMSFFRGGADKK